MELALKKMKWRNAAGSDGIMIEMVEALGECAIDIITDKSKKTYNTGTIPQRTKDSDFIVTPKKVGVVKCNKHRTISIISQVAKIVLKVIDERLKRKVAEYVDE